MIDDRQLDEVRRGLTRGRPIRSIAEAAGCSASTVRRIRDADPDQLDPDPPTPEEIRRQAAEIRAGWSPAERAVRASRPNLGQPSCPLLRAAGEMFHTIPTDD
jgi:hypothetical protein